MLRKLKMQDAPLMLEWMHDPQCVKDLQANFAEKTLHDCEAFIQFTWNNASDLHLAIVNEADEYMGTVSLKHIDHKNSSAEFAIAMRACAMGKGYSSTGMKEIIALAHNELGIDHVFWCVSPKNLRAVRFYDKNLYSRVSSDLLPIVGYTDEQIKSMLWYLA